MRISCRQAHVTSADPSNFVELNRRKAWELIAGKVRIFQVSSGSAYYSIFELTALFGFHRRIPSRDNG